MNDLQKYFNGNTGNVIYKLEHYFDIYDTYFSKYRNKKVNILEIGVCHGGSLRMWKDYFGPEAAIFGVDINPNCMQLEDGQTRVFIGSQEDRGFLRSLTRLIPKVDILIDDGGHTMRQQITTFEELYGHVADDGIYLCEDLHTSYWRNYGGKYKGRNTFVEYSKNFIDYIHAWHSRDGKLRVTDFTRSTCALHYYNSVLVIEKKRIEKPSDKKTGTVVIEEYVPAAPPASLLQKLARAIKRRCVR